MRHSQTRAARGGLTLIEVMIVVAILAIALAIVYPNIVRQDRPATASTEAELIEQAKALAIARAEPMRLTVQHDGAWEIVSEAAPGSGALDSGQLPEAPAYALELRVTELGACLPAQAGTRVEGAVIDAVSCRIRP